MALSETFAEIEPRNMRAIMPAKRAAPVRIPITARELVEWTYADQRAQGVMDVSLDGPDRSQTGIVFDLMTEFKLLGCNVDRSPGAVARWGETKCHEDAITVSDIIWDLPPRQRDLLQDHGRQRSIPDWQPKLFPLRCVPVRGNGGKPRGLYLGSGRLHVGSEVAYEGDWPSRAMADEHRVTADTHKRQWADVSNWPPAVRRRRSERPMAVEHDWSPEPWRRCEDEVLQRARDEYRAWYEALWGLCDGLQAAGLRGLSRYRITALGAACEPWSVQQDIDSTIVD